MGFLTSNGFKPAPFKAKEEEEYRTNLLEAIQNAQLLTENNANKTWEEVTSSIDDTIGEIRNVEIANSVLDDAIKKARRVGVDEHMVLAVESVRPGLIPENVRNMAAELPSKTNAERTIVALESGRSMGKFAMIAMLIAVILRIIAWVVDNGGKTKPAEDGDVANTNEAIAGSASAAREKDKSGELKDLPDVVVAAYHDAYKKVSDDSSDTDLAKLKAFAVKLAGPFKAHPGLNTLFIAIESVTKENGLSKVFVEYSKSSSEESALATLINIIRGRGVLDIFYNPKTIAALLGHGKLKGKVGLNRRMPTVTMWTKTRASLDHTVGMIDTFNTALVNPSESSIEALYKVVETFLNDYLLKGEVFEQSRVSNALYESPFTQRMSEGEWSEGFMALGTRVLTLAESGSIGKQALSPIYTELGQLPILDALDVLGSFTDEAVNQNGNNGRFKDVIKVDTQWAKRAKTRLDGYNQTIKNLNGDAGRQVLASYKDITKQIGARPVQNLRTIDGDPSEPFDLLSDMAKCMRSLWETYAALQQCADKHNKYSGLMRNFAEASKK